MEPTGPPPEQADHGNRKPFFLAVFVMLCVLTGVSFWIANSHLMQTPTTGWAAMVAVSVAKALLVILFFMHLWWEGKWKYVLTLPAMILGVVLVLLLVPDIGNRTHTWSKSRRIAAPAPIKLETIETIRIVDGE